MSDSENFQNWLKNQYLDWQKKEGELSSKEKFAEYLDIKPGTLRHWLSGLRYPTEENIHHLAKKLSPDIYYIVGLLNPNDEALNFIARTWNELPDETKIELIDIIRETLENQIKQRQEKLNLPTAEDLI